jgi:hypothetical protein
MTAELWHPHAKRVHFMDTGIFATAPMRCVLHTIEGTSASGALMTFRGSLSIPHFMIGPESGDLWQFLPINRYARALEHPSGTPETNRMGAIQVEQLGFANPTSRTDVPRWARQGAAGWPDSYYTRIHRLAVWISQNAGVELSRHELLFHHPERMSDTRWREFDGFCGHVHVPHQPKNHQDPGTGYHIDKTLHGVG